MTLVLSLCSFRSQSRDLIQSNCNYYYMGHIVLNGKVSHSPRSSRKHGFFNFDPFKLYFYIVKLGFTGIYIIFLISSKKIDCGYSLEPPRRGGSNEYPQSMVLEEI